MKSNNNQFLVNEYVCVLPFTTAIKSYLETIQKHLLQNVDEVATALPRGIVLFRCRALAIAEKSWLKLVELELRKWQLNEINITNVMSYPMHSFYANIKEKDLLSTYIKQFKVLEKRVLQLQLSADTIVPIQHNMQAKNFLIADKNRAILSGNHCSFKPEEIWLLRSESEQWVGCNKFLVNKNEMELGLKTA